MRRAFCFIFALSFGFGGCTKMMPSSKTAEAGQTPPLAESNATASAHLVCKEKQKNSEDGKAYVGCRIEREKKKITLPRGAFAQALYFHGEDKPELLEVKNAPTASEWHWLLPAKTANTADVVVVVFTGNQQVLESHAAGISKSDEIPKNSSFPLIGTADLANSNLRQDEFEMPTPAKIKVPKYVVGLPSVQVIDAQIVFQNGGKLNDQITCHYDSEATFAPPSNRVVPPGLLVGLYQLSSCSNADETVTITKSGTLITAKKATIMASILQKNLSSIAITLTKFAE